MRGKRLIITLVALDVLLVAAWLATPFLTVARFEQAALDRDTDTLLAMTDMAAVRRDLSELRRDRIVGALQRDPEMLENPLAGLGLAVVPDLADRMAGAVASPEGLSALVAAGEPPHTAEEARFPPPAGERQPVARQVGYADLNTFVLTVRRNAAPPERATRLVFKRRGLVTWRLVRVTPPA